MDIDLNDNTESNNFCINNNDNLKNNNLFETGKGEDSEMNIFQPNHKCIYGVNSQFFKSKKPSCELTLCEGRLQNDLAELKRSKIFGKICQIKYDNTYKKLENNKIEYFVEYVSFFTVKFIFNYDYPCTPPSIMYVSGLKPNHIFDVDGNVLIESIKKNNWTPSIWLSTLVYSIELLISSCINNENNYSNNNKNNNNLTSYFLKAKEKKYCKRNWTVYLDEMNKFYDKESTIIPELEHTLKQLKIK